MKDLFEAVTKKMMLGSRDTTYFDSADLQFELDVPSFTLFLEAFHKFLITSEISWQQTEKIAPKKSLKNFVVFLKNVLLSTYIQNYLTGADSITFQSRDRDTRRHGVRCCHFQLAFVFLHHGMAQSRA